MLSLTLTLFSLAVTAAHAVTGSAPPAEASRPPDTQLSEQVSAVPVFLAENRAVSNWRAEAMQDLQPGPLAAVAVALRVERPVISRCVKLNNYWCIKSARWSGEVGADEEGHVGFASAEHGADAAVRLLRRYYLDFDRKSALDIVRRWAPAECRIASGAGGSVALAVRGLGNTLRARWLAARRTLPGRTKVASASAAVPAPQRPARSRVSVVPMAPLPTVRVPDIMAGASAVKPVTLAATLTRPAVAPRRQPTPASLAAANIRSAQRSAARSSATAPAPPSRPPVVATAPAPPPRPPVAAAAAPPPRPAQQTSLCGSDEQRIQNYAARMVQGLDLRPGDDLKLFEADGRPLPNLRRVLLAMSSFELGYLGASVALVEAAIERAMPPGPVQDRSGPVPAEPLL